MQTILATYEDGVLKPSEPLCLPPHSKVQISIEVIESRLLTVGELNAFLQSLPKLGDDAEQFAKDIQFNRSLFPSQSSKWD
jgi:predicted DNA-binding antitoxin AbrB/MazE fold protein